MSTAVEDAAVKAAGGLATAATVPLVRFLHRWSRKRHEAAEQRRRAEIREEALIAVKPLQDAFNAHVEEDRYAFRTLLKAVNDLNHVAELTANDVAWLRHWHGDEHGERRGEQNRQPNRED